MKLTWALVILMVLFVTPSFALTIIENGNGTYTLTLDTVQERKLVKRAQALYGPDVLHNVLREWFNRKMRSFNFIDAELQKRQFDALTSEQRKMIEQQLKSTGIK